MHTVAEKSALSELEWFTSLLDKQKIPYWIDSGTLLGIMRDGQMLESDPDIDLNIWEKDEPNLRDLLREIAEARDYVIHSESFNGRLYSYWMHPKDHSRRFIDIGIFRASGEYAYRHAPIHRYKFSIMRKALRFAHLLVRRLKPKKTLISNIELGNWPVCTFIESRGCWWIPLSFLNAFSKISTEKFALSIPAASQDYLAFRYGNWRIPNNQWVYWRDDKAFQRKSPQELMAGHPNGN